MTIRDTSGKRNELQQFIPNLVLEDVTNYRGVQLYFSESRYEDRFLGK
jgi:hypothetical protein